MIVDSHMHVGDFPMFNVSMDRAGLVAEMPEHGIDSDLVFLSVYLEISGMPTRSRIAEAVERGGPDRVPYGSDNPFHHPSVELAKVRVSGLSTDLTDRLLGENGRALFFGEDAPMVVS